MSVLMSCSSLTDSLPSGCVETSPRVGWGRQHKGETTSRSGSYQVMSSPTRGDPDVDGQIHIKTTLEGVGVRASHAGAEAESIISVFRVAR